MIRSDRQYHLGRYLAPENGSDSEKAFLGEIAIDEYISTVEHALRH